MFKDPIPKDNYITICGIHFPDSTGAQKYGKITVREQRYNDKPNYTWIYESEGGDNCNNQRFSFNEMIIALKTKNKGNGAKDLKDLITKLELYKSDGTRGNETFEIQREQLNNSFNGGECIYSRIGKGSGTKWSSAVDNDFSRFISPRLGLKSVQCQSGNSAEVKN